MNELKKNKKRVSLRIRVDILEELQKIANKDKRTLSNLITKLIEKYIENGDKK